MSPYIRLVFEQFMAKAFPNDAVDSPYYKSWEQRFEQGWEWQRSDYAGRRILKDIASEIYPDDKDKFFNRLGT